MSKGGHVPGTHLQETSNPAFKVKDRVARPPEKGKNFVSVAVALPGQSYNPDKSQHQDALGLAVSVEVAREERKREDKKGPEGMSEETLRVLLSGDEDSDSDSDDDDDEVQKPVKVVRREGKKTIAQRNKQARHRKMLAEHREEKRRKRLNAQAVDLKGARREERVKR